MTRRLWYPLAIFALAAALLPMSVAAAPSDTTDSANAVDPVGPEQAKLLRLLNSDSVKEQERAVRLIGTYAHTGTHSPYMRPAGSLRRSSRRSCEPASGARDSQKRLRPTSEALGKFRHLETPPVGFVGPAGGFFS